MSKDETATASTWKSQGGYIWSLIGSAVGFANILSFSAKVYGNGGGAFLIPYCLALFMLGIPLLILEGIIGYRKKVPLVAAYGQVCGNIGKTIGWLSVLACLTIGGFYIVLTGYSFAYAYFSATDAIPADTKAFFSNQFLKISTDITDFGQLSLPVVAVTLCVCVLTWFVLVRNVRDGIERICTIFMPLLAMIMTICALVVSFLPGGLDGWIYYLKPNFDRLWEPALWRDVFGQLFFSLSLGLGIIVGYSRHTGKATNIPRAMFYVALGDFAVSFISGAAIFGCLAHISHMQHVPFDSILTTDSTFEIGFILFPHMLKFFGPVWAQLIGTVFFFCIFIAGITGVFSIVESVVGNIEVEFKTTRKKAVTMVISALMMLGLIFCMGNAAYVIEAVVPMVLGTNMLIGGLALIVVFAFLCPDTGKDPFWQSSRGVRGYAFCLRVVAPTVLALILIGNLVDEFSSFSVEKGVRWTWFAAAFGTAKLLTYCSRLRAQRTGTVIA